MRYFETALIKKEIVITLLFSVVCGYFNLISGFICMGLGMVHILMIRNFDKKMHEQISKLCDNIDEVLMGNDTLNFGDFSEGDISILETEINKMTLKIREQNTALNNDKIMMKNAAADISHQLKTPLTSMNLILSMITKPDIKRTEFMAYIQNLAELLNRTQWLMDVMLKLSQFDAKVIKMQKKIFNPEEAIGKCLSAVEISAELKEIDINVHILDKQAEINGDINWFCEALTNIMTNCIKHTPRGGNIGITVEQTAVSTIIKIKDSGKGIPENELLKIFDRFYTKSDFASQGYGIGLALAKKIITEQNGIIQAKIDKTPGALFVITMYKSTI